jgi:hypothetical protein
MTFKEFLRLSEEASATDKGLMGYPIASEPHKPSDGLPFKDKLGCVAGQTPRGPNSSPAVPGGSPGAGPSPMMMKKKMKKR